MAKIKNSINKVDKKCTNCFKSNHITFNFAYVTYDNDFIDRDKNVLIDRMREVSAVPYIEMRMWNKYKGFEEVRLTIDKQIPNKFEEDIQKFDGKYSIMRLYKNNEPTPGRIIGKIVNKVFYIFYIDVKGTLYDH